MGHVATREARTTRAGLTPFAEVSKWPASVVVYSYCIPKGHHERYEAPTLRSRPRLPWTSGAPSESTGYGPSRRFCTGASHLPAEGAADPCASDAQAPWDMREPMGLTMNVRPSRNLRIREQHGPGLRGASALAGADTPGVASTRPEYSDVQWRRRRPKFTTLCKNRALGNGNRQARCRRGSVGKRKPCAGVLCCAGP